MKRTFLVAMFVAVGCSVAHAEEVCSRHKVYGRVLKVEPITEVATFPSTSQDCSSGQCVSYVSQVSTSEAITGYRITYRLGGKTSTIRASEPPSGVTIELIKESCVEKPAHRALKAGSV